MADVLVPDALLDLDCARVEVHAPPYQAEHLRDSCATGDADFDDQTNGFFQAIQHPRGLLKREDPTLVLVAFPAEFRPARRAALALLPQAMALGVIEDAAHDRSDAVHGPPRVECRVQPILHRFRLDLI